MIQRKQSVYLLLSVILFACTFMFPFGTLGTNEIHNYAVLAADHSKVEGIQHYFFSACLAVASIISLITIFLYSNRGRQMAILRLSFITFAFGFALLALYIRSAGAVLSNEKFQFGISFFLPFGSFLLNLLALRAIRKDEKLVKSLDRLR